MRIDYPEVPKVELYLSYSSIIGITVSLSLKSHSPSLPCRLCKYERILGRLESYIVGLNPRFYQNM